MARVFNINTDKFTLLQEIERLRYCLSQYETLLGVKPFDKELLKGDKGDKGDRGKALYYTDLTPEQIKELQRPAADMIAELTVLQEELNRVEALRQQAEELRVQQNQEALSNANTARNLAIEVVTHPPVIVNDVWYRWNFITHTYETTGNKAIGESAYQVWLDAGNEGSYTDYENWIRKPATDVAEVVNAEEIIRQQNEVTRQENIKTIIRNAEIAINAALEAAFSANSIADRKVDKSSIVYITQIEYEMLADNGQLLPDIEYNVYEE